MSPNLESLDSNSSHCIHHTYVSKNWFSREEALHMTHNPKPGKNQNVNFWMSKKPKQMLILDHISSSSRQEETCIKITVSQLHGQTCSKNWQASNKLNTYEAHSPNEQRKSIQSHSLSTHVCNSHLKVNRSQNTSDSCNMLAKNSLIYRSSGMTQSTTQRWISGPSNTRTLLHLCAKLLKSQTHGQK